MFGFLTASLLLACAQDDPGTTAQAAPAPAAAQEVLRVERWLTMDKVDEGGRIPVSPDQVFLRHLIDPTSPHPVDGEEVVGTFATHSWKSATAGDDGNVPVPRGGWAYATIEVPEDGVWLARLAGAIRIHVNGEAFVGDLYRYGFGGVPVFLKKGPNHLYIAGARGSFSLDFVGCEEGVLEAPWDRLVPDLVLGDLWRHPGALLLMNASQDRVLDPALASASGDGLSLARVFGGLVPLGMRRVPLYPAVGAPEVEEGLRVSWVLVEDREAYNESLAATVREGLKTAPISSEPLDGPIRGKPLPLPNGIAGGEVDFPIVPRNATQRRTFFSWMDRSIQSFGYVPAADGDAQGEGLVLSLHGASVEAMNQARAYSAKDDFAIAAPTNRRPYGFDWQDWGRLDAYEVLGVALRATKASADQVHLTGHSMGGHGTWHLGVNDPDRWASIAPSAGWSSFDSYGGRPTGELDEVWRAADGASETMGLLPNLRGVPVSVLHGDADDNVPASEARAMVDALTELGIRHQVHFEPDAGHWWGNRCVDWPGFFSMFRATKRKQSSEVLAFDWRSASPVVDSRHYWFEALQRLDASQPIRVRAQVREVDGYLRIELATENVRAFRLYPRFEGDVREVAIDGHLEWADLGEGPLPRAAIFRYYGWEGSPRQQEAERLGGALGALGGEKRDHWVRLEDTQVPDGQKNPRRDGPFKRAFNNGFVLVYGTGGDDARDAALLARARHDAAQWWYRGNGDCPVMSDVEFQSAGGNDLGYYRGGNIILYGNRESNLLWPEVVPEDCPLDVAEYGIRLGDEVWEGDDALALAVYRRKDSDESLVGIIAETGLKGARLGDAMKYFVSGTGYPDYLVISSKVLAEGDKAVLAAGFFDYAWQLPK